MSCSCIRGDKYNIHVDAYREALLYRDFSDWNTEQPYVIPNSYTLDITLPERHKSNRVEVDLNGSILPSDLGVMTIPDGIYKFSLVECGESNYKGCCGVIYCTHQLIYPHLQCCIDDAYAMFPFEEVDHIHSYFKQAEVLVQLNLIKDAVKVFNVGKKKLKALNCDCPCWKP
jgi:hypothetical protein